MSNHERVSTVEPGILREGFAGPWRCPFSEQQVLSSVFNNNDSWEKEV